jgi:hypothetical protein
LNKASPYILLTLLIGAVIVLFITAENNQPRKLDERITLRKRDKIPYGSYVAFEQLKYLFPSAVISVNRREPGYWDSLSSFTSGQALITLSAYFNASRKELTRMLKLAEAGNDVFVSSRYIDESVQDVLKVETYPYSVSSYFSLEGQEVDTLHIALEKSRFGSPSEFQYPGRKFNAYFSRYDSSITTVYGRDENGHPNFIRLRTGKGSFYLHLAPLTFSNFFLLHRDNIRYYEKALSLITPSVKTVVWDEYFLRARKHNQRKERDSWLNVLFRYPALRAALLTAIITLLIYVLLEMRRKQRYIPFMPRPKNDSLDFVRTIGRLYYDKADHRNLSKKMGAYFLEHIRNRYKLQTNSLDEEFIRSLQYKSGADESLLNSIISFIRYADDAPLITHRELAGFHKDLEAFYKIA